MRVKAVVVRCWVMRPEVDYRILVDRSGEAGVWLLMKVYGRWKDFNKRDNNRKLYMLSKNIPALLSFCFFAEEERQCGLLCHVRGRTFMVHLEKVSLNWVKVEMEWTFECRAKASNWSGVCSGTQRPRCQKAVSSLSFSRRIYVLHPSVNTIISPKRTWKHICTT